MALLMGGALGAQALYSYNRDNFKFDRTQTLEREVLRIEMQIKRFELFRDDVRDLVNLTVDRMDVYHLIGALFLKFCIVIFCKGRIQGSAPPFVLHLFQLSNASAFIYLLLAVWLSMHASIASHSFGVRMLTRFVRLPIPSQRQILALQFNLKDFEKQSVANLMRMPFQDHQEWEQVHKKGTAAEPSSASTRVPFLNPSASAAPKALPVLGRQKSFKEADCVAGGAVVLDDKETQPFEDLLAGHRGAMPERHVQLFRKMQLKWQCYDAYCRVCMGLGLNHILQGLSYYAICHTLVENSSPTTGFGLVLLFQSATIIVAFLDLAGLQHREIVTVQVVSIVPCFLTALEVAMGSRTEEGVLLPDQDYKLAPVSFLCHALWLELWLRIAWPSSRASGDLGAQLPRRFRQVLFLDVFGDSGSNLSAEDDAEPSLFDIDMEEVESPRHTAASRALNEAACRAASRLTAAQAALRRWQAVPIWCHAAGKSRELARLEEQRTHWGAIFMAELQRCGPVLPAHSELVTVFEQNLRQWKSLSLEEQEADSFAKCLLGPFEHVDDHGKPAMYHYDLEKETCLFYSNDDFGSLVLSLSATDVLIKDLEKEVRILIEMRVLRDLSVVRRTQEVRARVKSQRPDRRSAARRLKDKLRTKSKKFGTNLVGLFNQEQSRGRDWTAVPANSSGSLTPCDSASQASADDIASPQTLAADVRREVERAVEGNDRTMTAVAGKHVQDFVPERLPWLILYRITRVGQLIWFVCGTMVLLKEAGIYQHDWQQYNMRPGRRLEEVLPLGFEAVSTTWPSGAFFIPQNLFCADASGVFVTSPYFLYEVSHLPGRPLQLEELFRVELPAAASLISMPPGSRGLTDMVLAAPRESGLAFWSFGEEHEGQTVVLPIDSGEPWHLLAAGLLPCATLQRREEAWCLLLAGWDGEMVPVAVLPLPGEASSGVPGGKRLLRLLAAAGRVQPSMAAPLTPGASPSALHLEASGRLWALLQGGSLQAWNLVDTRRAAHWQPVWPLADGMAVKPLTLCVIEESSCDAQSRNRSTDGGCEASSSSLLVLSRTESAHGPFLFRASVDLTRWPLAAY
eukprot:TRINITY_DN48276_c0_g1_i1.p1 TRINITY_DN48276_c0_g1~~TRINITY_DN48276_c0_g1_i1.p1  ORF type:complete len:1081 (+),score=208.20 TRINITY_DN48276_c0_g1_i1:69-3311(+)